MNGRVIPGAEMNMFRLTNVLVDAHANIKQQT